MNIITNTGSCEISRQQISFSDHLSACISAQTVVSMLQYIAYESIYNLLYIYTPNLYSSLHLNAFTNNKLYFGETCVHLIGLTKHLIYKHGRFLSRLHLESQHGSKHCQITICFALGDCKCQSFNGSVMLTDLLMLCKQLLDNFVTG